MKDNYFKSREEINQFFKGQTLKFSFKSENEIFFDTLNPIYLGGVYYRFQLSFYFNHSDFFCYSTLNGENGWLDKFKISSVESINTDITEREKLYES